MIPLHILAALALALAPPAVGIGFTVKPTLWFNMTFTAADAMLAFLPDDNTTETSWSIVGANTSVPSNSTGNGTILAPDARRMAVRLDVPSVVYPPRFVLSRMACSGAYVYGTLREFASSRPSSSLFTLTVDPEVKPHDLYRANVSDTVDGLVLGSSEEEWGSYAVKGALNIGRLAFEKLVVTTGMETEATSMDNVTIMTQPFVLNGQLNPFFTFGGYTRALNDTTQPWNISTTNPPPMHPSSLVNLSTPNVVGERARIDFLAPPHAAFIVITGGVGPSLNQSFSLSIRPGLPDAYANLYFPTRWPYVAQGTIWAMPLDRWKRYNISITAYNNSTALGGVTFYSGFHASDGIWPAERRQPFKGKTGAIVGSLVGTFGIAIIIYAFWVIRRRAARKRARSDQHTNSLPLCPTQSGARQSTYGPAGVHRERGSEDGGLPGYHEAGALPKDSSEDDAPPPPSYGEVIGQSVDQSSHR